MKQATTVAGPRRLMFLLEPDTDSEGDLQVVEGDVLKVQGFGNFFIETEVTRAEECAMIADIET